ncbi:MAG: saccharopine dehydrogenase [Kangiellaceae bacterium]|jgi:saccharopine dehydrogenase-like NADP-dependent oxidoreductase|nr:saccharopine dehydrogenase [Kangiellaceae bacterium]|tara:strand:+ start:237 stop:1337 length:1101 start_codon:yes stop_codon:yes gene_type:complete
MSQRPKIAVIGVGKIGSAISKFLAHSGDYQVVAVDINRQSLERIAHLANLETVCTKRLDYAALAPHLSECVGMISALDFPFNPALAEVALQCGVSYFDLTEDRETGAAIRRTAEKARQGQIFMPHCGLAPGAIGILAHHVASAFDSVESIHMRVGALPQFPTNKLMYNLTWSTEGLVNEYANPCEVIKQGKRIEVPALDGIEHFSLDGKDYEAFNTSGGLGSLCETWLGRCQELNYKTIRYPGHQYLMDFLINELQMGLPEKRSQLKVLLDQSIPMTPQDVVIMFVNVTGEKDGRFQQMNDSRKIYHHDLFDEHLGSIQITTSASVCAVVDMHCQGYFDGVSGFVKQEAIEWTDFVNNRFGQYYAV